MKVVVAVKAVAAPDDEVELVDDDTAVDPDGLEWDLNEWDAFSLEEALTLRDAAGDGEVVAVTVGGEEAQDSLLAALAKGADRGVRVWDARHKDTVEVDTVVLCTQRLSNDELYRELKSDPAALEREGIEGLYIIGDASAPRMIVDSIFDGHRLAREIDSDNPAMPLPFIRERRLWGETGNSDFEAQLLAPSDMVATT